MDCCDVEAEELTDMELADGESRLEFRGGNAATLGNNDFPFPSTLPPPGFLDDIVSHSLELHRDRELHHMDDELQDGERRPKRPHFRLSAYVSSSFRSAVDWNISHGLTDQEFP